MSVRSFLAESWEGKGEIQAVTRANSFNASLEFSDVFVLLAWRAIRCTPVEFAWSRDLHELLFLAKGTSVRSVLPVLQGARAPIRGRICVPGCSGQQKPSALGRKDGEIETKLLI